MGKLLYTINTVNNFMDIIFNPFGKPFAEANPDIEVYNIMDDSLLVDTRKYNGMTPTIASRMLNYAKAAEASDADGVICTCTSVNHATKMIRPLLNIPLINIEEPVAEMAAKSGKRIGVMGTIPTSPGDISWEIEEKAAEMGKEIEIVPVVVDGAFDVLCAGDRDKHDEMVCEALYKLSKEVDCIAFAQISMSLLKHEPVDVPLFKIGASGFDKIKELMNCK